MVSGSAPVNASPRASWSPRSTRSCTNGLTSVSRCGGPLGALICCLKPEHASSTAISINSSVAATQRLGKRQETTFPRFVMGSFLPESRPPTYAITGADGYELSGRWQEALERRDMIRALCRRIELKDCGVQLAGPRVLDIARIAR
jgi:hypothetical protein